MARALEDCDLLILPRITIVDPTQGFVLPSSIHNLDPDQLDAIKEFLKSGKLLPVHFSSRHYDFKRNKWVFGKANDDAIAAFLERKVYWQTRLAGGRVWIADPTEALYLETSPAHLLEIAGRLAEHGLIKLEGEYATANSTLIAQGEKFESAMRDALRELEKKHEFERG